MFGFPDNPVRVSESFLKELDAAPPGTWSCQKKLDGRLRIVTRCKPWLGNPEGYTWRAKDRPSAQDVPADLKAEFEALQWPDGVTILCEWVGPRVAGQKHELYLFDMIESASDTEVAWLGAETFAQRFNLLKCITRSMLPSENIHILKPVYNPGMVEYYEACKSDPMCEGIVVRSKDHKHQGAEKCTDARSGFYKCKWR